MIAMKINKRNSTIRDYTVYSTNFYTDYIGKDSEQKSEPLNNCGTDKSPPHMWLG